MKKSKEIAITVKNLDIMYKEVKSFSIKRGELKKISGAKVFHAVKNVSFDVKKGEIIAFVEKMGVGNQHYLGQSLGFFLLIMVILIYTIILFHSYQLE